MKIQEILSARASQDELSKRLSAIAARLCKEVENHQKRVLKIMPEFDLHDEVHLSKVEEIMADYIGDDILKELSSIDLFLLIMAAWFHDCGMALADFELNTLMITEGYGEFRQKEESICHDLKKPFLYSEAISFIKERSSLLYGSFENNVSSWLFSPNKEEDLVKYLAKELVDYQNFRNGYADKLKSVNKSQDFLELNNNIRTEYIRKTHAIRSEQYVLNLSDAICKEAGSAWPKSMIEDIAKICRAHGEAMSYVSELYNNIQYHAGIIANPQFTAMMLRLADIVQFSEDRAPMVLMNAMMFKSEYSFQQWAMKIGLSYTIQNGEVSYSVNCDSPAVYYQLQDYMDWVDEEVHNFQTLKENWNSLYKIPIKLVNREYVKYNHNYFTPARGKKFRLEQNNILNLLMGLKLYNNEYSGIRELYQNALDACRCKKCHCKDSFSSVSGNIEFGVKEANGEKYLYCLDNGIGMTTTIIEKYLLNIGSSYYKSEDFFRNVTTWKNGFTPVSQFGIGILSCFMIGKRIEITTRSYEAKEYISCCIEGPTEYFYYKPSDDLDKELIPESGTIVKIYLKEEFANAIATDPLVKLGLVMQYPKSNICTGEFSDYDQYYNQWEQHLYKLVSDYVCIKMEDVNVSIRLSDSSLLQIIDRPTRINLGEYGLDKDDVPFINFLATRNFCESDSSFCDILDKLVEYKIKEEVEGVQYYTMFALPLKDAPRLDDGTYSFLIHKIHGSSICIDGITVSEQFSGSLNHYESFILHSGTVNFTGSIRPSLSANRVTITNMPSGMTEIYKSLAEKVVSSMISITMQHIKNNHLDGDVETCNQIWQHIFNRIANVDLLFVNNLASSSLGSMTWPCLSKYVGKDISIQDFMNAREISLSNYNYWEMDALTQKLVLSKFITATHISVMQDNVVTIKTDHVGYLPDDEQRFTGTHYLIKVNEENEVFTQCDILSHLYPLTSSHLFQKLRKSTYRQLTSDRVVSVQAFSNGITAFYEQDSRLVNPEMGLYCSHKEDFHRKDHEVYRFESKRTNISMFYLGEDGIRNNSKPHTMVLSYVAPHMLTEMDQKLIISRGDDATDYGRGVKDGWTILATGMDKYNIIIKPGYCTRDEMAKAIPDLFWEIYKDVKFVFLDGTEIKPNDVF